MTLRAEDLIDALTALSEKEGDVGADLEDLVAQIQNDGVESRPHVRALVDVNALQECSDQECSHEDGCPTVKMFVCLGCSQDEPNEDGVIWYRGWQMSEWKHHADYFAACTPECQHGAQPAPRADIVPETSGSGAES